MLGYGPDVVLLAGHSDKSAENLANSVDSSHKSLSITKLTELITSGNIPSQTKLIIIDEINGSSFNEITAFADAFSKLDRNDIQVIVMGDPRQITKDHNSLITMTRSFPLTEQSSDRGISQVIDIQPLFTRFRSDNPSIVNIQDSFVNQINPVQGLTGTTNVDSQTITSVAQSIVGSFVESTNSQLVPIIKNSIKVNPGRKKAIIVESIEEVDSTKAKLKTAGLSDIEIASIEIITYIEAQGRTLEEVYVDLPFKGSDQSGGRLEYNTKMYTATSRATEFLYVAHIPNAKNTFDPLLEDKVNLNKKQKLDNFDTLQASLKRKADIISSLGLTFASAPSTTIAATTSPNITPPPGQTAGTNSLPSANDIFQGNTNKVDPEKEEEKRQTDTANEIPEEESIEDYAELEEFGEKLFENDIEKEDLDRREQEQRSEDLKGNELYAIKESTQAAFYPIEITINGKKRKV